MTFANSRIAIIGGGIGGLATALSLLKSGFDVHVYEQAGELREVGAGIVLTPNVSRLLHGLGLTAPLEHLAVAPAVVRQRRWQDGSTLLMVPVQKFVGASGEHHFYTVHRADVLTMLADALPPERIHLGHRLTALADKGTHVELEFANAARASADVVVGADGIHSVVRGALFGAAAPQFTGCVAYRGMVSADRFPKSDLQVESQLCLGPGSHFVNYPVRRRELINFVCLVDRDAWTKESWTEPGDPAELRAIYRDWHPQVRALVDSVTEIFVWGLFDREPLPRWSVGRVTLLGDACHPMLPFLAQGAAQAIEDGVVLTACLKGGAGDIPAALARYETLRKPRTARIQLIARGNRARNHLPDGPEQQARDAAMASGRAEWSIGAADWIYSYDATKADDDYLGLPHTGLNA
ncbi:MAG: FAD-dependent monooxygenase [Pseudolabrys sp.]